MRSALNISEERAKNQTKSVNYNILQIFIIDILELEMQKWTERKKRKVGL